MTQIDHLFFFISHKAKHVSYCLISHNSPWEITGFHWYVRAQLCILRASLNTELISSGIVGRDFFSLVIRLTAINCVWGLSHRVSGMHLLLLCCCTMTGDRNVLRLHSCLQRAAVPGRQESTVTTEQSIRWNYDEWGMKLFNSLGSKRMMPFLQDT